MKLYTVRGKVRNEVITFVLDNEDNPKDYIKAHCYIDCDLRTLKEQLFPKGRFECSSLDHMHYIFFNGEMVVDWDDTANCNYPEDLCWNRDIGGLIEQVEKLKELEFESRLDDLETDISMTIYEETKNCEDTFYCKDSAASRVVDLIKEKRCVKD